MHDQMDHFKPFTLIHENGITKYQDVFSVEEGNGTFVVSPSHPDAYIYLRDAFSGRFTYKTYNGMNIE